MGVPPRYIVRCNGAAGPELFGWLNVSGLLAVIDTRLILRIIHALPIGETRTRFWALLGRYSRIDRKR